MSGCERGEGDEWRRTNKTIESKLERDEQGREKERGMRYLNSEGGLADTTVTQDSNSPAIHFLEVVKERRKGDN